MIKCNDQMVFQSLLKHTKFPLISSSHKNEFAFHNNDQNYLIIKNLFSIIDSSEKCVSKLDILDMSMSLNDFYQENIKIICDSNINLDENMLKINNPEFREKYKSYYHKFNLIYTNIKELRTNLIEGKSNDVIGFHNNMEEQTEKIRTYIEEALNDQNISDSKEIKQLMLYKIGYLDLLADIMSYLCVDRYMKKALGKDIKKNFYEKVLKAISLIVDNNSFLIRLMLSTFYVTKFFSVKKKKVQFNMLSFYERNMKTLRQDFLCSDVTFFCHYVGEIYKKEYLRFVNSDNKTTKSKRDFIVKFIMVLSCFKVCMEIMNEKNFYIISKKVYYFILNIITEKNKGQCDEDEEEIEQFKIEKDTFFNHNLQKLGREEKISIVEKGNYFLF